MWQKINAVNSYDECHDLAEGLQLNVRGEDIVKKTCADWSASWNLGHGGPPVWAVAEAWREPVINRAAAQKAEQCLPVEPSASGSLWHSQRWAESNVQRKRSLNWVRQNPPHDQAVKKCMRCQSRTIPCRNRSVSALFRCMSVSATFSGKPHSGYLF